MRRKMNKQRCEKLEQSLFRETGIILFRVDFVLYHYETWIITLIGTLCKKALACSETYTAKLESWSKSETSFISSMKNFS